MEILEYKEDDASALVMRIKIDSETLTKAYDKALDDLVKDAEIPGFRRGKAPRKVVERHTGVPEIWETARDKASEEAFEAALKEKEVEVEGEPEYEREEYKGEGDYEFSVTFKKKAD